MVPREKRSHCFSALNLRLVFEKVKFDVRRSLEPFKDLDGRFDPSSTALTKRSQTLSNGFFFLFFGMFNHGGWTDRFLRCLMVSGLFMRN